MEKEIKIKEINSIIASSDNKLRMEATLDKYLNEEELVNLMKASEKKIVYEVKDEILDEEEKRYLGNLIRPFRDRIDSITKNADAFGDDCYIEISLNNGTDSMNLPHFEKDEMYLGMEEDKEYSLEELGL